MKLLIYLLFIIGIIIIFWWIVPLILILLDGIWIPILVTLVVTSIFLLIKYIINNNNLNKHIKWLLVSVIVVVSVIIGSCIIFGIPDFRSNANMIEVVEEITEMPEKEDIVKTVADQGRDSVVNLSFQDFHLGSQLNKGIFVNSKKYANLKIEKIEDMDIYHFKGKISIENEYHPL